MKSTFLKLNAKDVSKALVMAIISGAVMPLAVAVQTPEFSIFTAQWHDLGVLALNGAVIGFISYLLKNLASDSEGKIFGRIG